MTYSNADIKDNSVKSQTKYNLALKIICRAGSKGQAQWTFEYTPSDYIQLTTFHEAGCAQELRSLSDLMYVNKYITLFLFSSIGAVLYLFARSKYNWTLLASGFLFGFFIISCVSYFFGGFKAIIGRKHWVLPTVAITIGLVSSLILYKLKSETPGIVSGILSGYAAIAFFNYFGFAFGLSKYLEVGICTLIGCIGGIVGWKQKV